MIWPSESSDSSPDPTAQPYWWLDKHQSGQEVSGQGGLNLSSDDQSLKGWQDKFSAEFPQKGFSRSRGDSNDSDTDSQAFHGLIAGGNSDLRTGRSHTGVDSELIEPDRKSSGESTDKSFDWGAAYASMGSADISITREAGDGENKESLSVPGSGVDVYAEGTRIGNIGTVVEYADYSSQASLIDESIPEAGACGVDRTKVFTQSPESLEASILRSDSMRADWERIREDFKAYPDLLEEYDSLSQEHIDYVDVKEQLYMSLPFGEGGFGQVARVTVDDDRKLVYKRALKKEGGTVAHENAILRKLNHPNIIKVSELGGGRSCLVKKRRKSGDKPSFDVMRVHDVAEQFQSGYFMEFQPRSLAAAIEQGILTNSEREKIAFGVIDALSYLERNRILHLDIKPDNILLSDEGQPKVCDFGNAKEFGNDDEGWLTDTTDGTLCFMPVELALVRDRKKKKMPYSQVDGAKADAWSLGITLLELYFSNNVDSLWNNYFISFLVAHMDEKRITTDLPGATEKYLSALKGLVNQLPEPIRHVVSQLLKINPDERWKISDAMRYLKSEGYMSSDRR
ncbi:hypothetical protein GCM10023116_25720 [Kistimonas scapharcae]|uniref:Protein kinase domain-containing protein n=1 Tax=Kistimonas scapharcae TaxID=1036133 RepID=A0ABP8V2Q4_9GAMM